MIGAIEAASVDASVALVDDDGSPIGVRSNPAGSQGEDLLPLLSGLLDEAGVPLSSLIALSVGLGPGSFTGLRAAMSLAKGLAFGRGLPVIGIPSLVGWLEAEPDARAALSRAGAREVHLLVRGEADSRLVTAEGLADALAGQPVVAPTDVIEQLGLARANGPTRAALAIGRLAAARLARGEVDDLTTLEPIYGRLPRGVERLDAGDIRWL
jgi:tRNA threonylcarbamoyl adenosine modification protein YeaZ